MTAQGEEYMIRRLITIAKLLSLVVVLIFVSVNEASAQLSVTGIVRAEDEVIIKSELSGLVRRIAVTEGERVLEGQLMVELENEHQKINLELSRTGMVKAKAAIDETQVVLENAEKELARIQIAASALPRKELEDIRDQVLRLKASLAAQMADLARAEQEVKLREQELKDTEIRAPFDGTITEIFINRGDSLRPIETPVLQIVGLDLLFAELRLPSSYVPNVRLQQPVRVQVEGEWMGRVGQVEGRVTYINPTIDAASRTFKIKVGIPANRGTVRPGMLVEARF
jgi:RND family efflux transporter MFP subunit